MLRVRIIEDSSQLLDGAFLEVSLLLLVYEERGSKRSVRSYDPTSGPTQESQTMGLKS